MMLCKIIYMSGSTLICDKKIFQRNNVQAIQRIIFGRYDDSAMRESKYKIQSITLILGKIGKENFDKVDFFTTPSWEYLTNVSVITSLYCRSHNLISLRWDQDHPRINQSCPVMGSGLGPALASGLNLAFWPRPYLLAKLVNCKRTM